MSHHTSITLSASKNLALDTVVSLLSMHKAQDYYAYEREDHWHVGLGSHATLVVDSSGETVTVNAEGKQHSFPADRPIAQISKDFVSAHSKSKFKVFGQVGFNYACHIRGLSYTPGSWPLLSLMVPRTEITFYKSNITVSGPDSEVRELCGKIIGVCHRNVSSRPQKIDTTEDGDVYKSRVSNGLVEISDSKYAKAILSRPVKLQERVDMPGTLYKGRMSNTPARSFSLSHAGFQATGFSPELVVSVQDREVITEPLAGTRSNLGTEDEIKDKREDLLSDPKEITEHIISVKEAIHELGLVCTKGTIMVKDLMSIRPRGSVQHLGSCVGGTLRPNKDNWDAFDALFPSITATGIPKKPALEAIQRLETQPRELYSGAILFLDQESELFEASLVLRTVFQDKEKQWIQAGAGIIALSNPERELTETQEKLASIAPFVVADAKS